MAEFSIQDAAFTGFRVVREHPRALAYWTLYALVQSLTFTYVAVSTMGPDIVRILAFHASDAADPTEILATFARMAPICAMLLPFALASNAILGAAMIRAVLNPGDDRYGFLRLGSHELRQLGLAILSFAVFLAAYFALAVVLGLLLGLAAGSVDKAEAGSLVILALAIVLAGLTGLWIRLSLAPALTFTRGRIDLFGSWALTRGRFWPMAGTYLLALALIAVVNMLSALVIFAVGTILTGGDPVAAMAQADMSTVASYFTPSRLVEMTLSAGVSALIAPVWLAPPTAMFRQIAGAARAAPVGSN